MTIQEQDDALSLQALANGDATLDMIYPWQFIQNEEQVGVVEAYDRCCSFRLAHPGIGGNTVVGTVYYNGEAIQTFVQQCRRDNPNFFIFTDIGYPQVKMVFGTIDFATGDIKMTWNSPLLSSPIFVVSYEYEYAYDGSFPSWRTYHQPKESVNWKKEGF